jgi:hypothetical protein
MAFETLHGIAGYKRRAYTDVSDLDWDINLPYPSGKGKTKRGQLPN